MIKWRIIKNIRVLILAASSRCGSTALSEYYNKRYNIKNIFFGNFNNPYLIINKLKKRKKYVLKIEATDWGRRLKHLHKEYIQSVFSQSNTHVILLYRKSIIETILSLAHAQRNNSWVNRDGSNWENYSLKDKDIKILVNEALDELPDYVENIKYINEAIEYIKPKQILEYNDIIKLPQKYISTKINVKNSGYYKALAQLNSKFKKQLVYESKYFKIV